LNKNEYIYKNKFYEFYELDKLDKLDKLYKLDKLIMETKNILNELIIWLKEKRNLWLKDFAHLHNISFAKLKAESLENEDTRELLQIALEMQESKLIKIALLSGTNVKAINSILEFINKSPASTETEENKPVPTIRFYLKKPPDANEPEDIINNNIENNKPNHASEIIDSS